MTAPPPDDTTTNLHAVIAALRAERDAAVAREAKRDSDYAERAAHQKATVEVLQAMAASPGDPKPVFEVIVRRARDLCDGYGVSLAQVVDNSIVLQAYIVADEALGKRHEAGFPRPVTGDTIFGRTILAREPVQIPDVAADVTFALRESTLRGAVRALVAVPLMRDGEAIGAIDIARRQTGEFSPAQIELLQVLANQAVIAINSAETYLALQTRTADLQESLEYQTATSDVLKIISRSAFDLQPVLDTVVETAARLCDADMAGIGRREGELVRGVAFHGYPPEYRAWIKSLGAMPLDRHIVGHRAALEGRVVHVRDVAADPDYPTGSIALGKMRTSLGVPLLREGETIGSIVLARQRVEPFTDSQIELVSTFADQAVIAIENTRLITEQQEALEQQTATAEVLQVINASPGNLEPVFDAMLEKAVRLCDSPFGLLYTYDGEFFRAAAMRGVTPALANANREPMRPGPGGSFGRLVNGEDIVHIADITGTSSYQSKPLRQAFADQGSARTALWVALRKDAALLGTFVIYRLEVRPFSDKQIALLENFAAQAVIAMENARLLDEIRRRQEELRITFENMGDGVAMFDETPRLVAWNRKFQEIFDVPGGLLEEHRTFADYIRYLAERGEYGAEADPEEHVRRLIEQAGKSRTYERTRPNGRTIEIRQNPVPVGGFVLIYADITERKRNEAEIRAARDAAEAAFRDLKAAQANLIQAEKMASLGQLTAGIAHEIKNPLNFVNNFAALSVDLLSELKETAAPGFAALTDHQRAEIDDVSAMLTSNLEKITEHGKRADGIVKAMLEHSRGSSAERRMVDLNALIDEALNLGYHGARAQDQSFNITLERDFGEGIAPIEVNPQDMTRVFLNLFANGFYATTKRTREGGDAAFMPTLKVTTIDAGEAVEIRVRDNGIGIPANIRDKLFQPFFTTKPTGEGTGLGLSITYDIVTQQHGGDIAVDSKVGDYSEFRIRLPRKP